MPSPVRPDTLLRAYPEDVQRLAAEARPAPVRPPWKLLHASLSHPNDSRKGCTAGQHKAQ